MTGADESRARVWGTLWLILVIAVFLVPYLQLWTWAFPASTAALLLLFTWHWGRGAFRRVGIPLHPRAVTLTLLLGVVLWLVFRFVLTPWTIEDQDVELRPWAPLYVATFAFQALNEEMVLGALLLFGLVRVANRPVVVAVGVAVVFAALHYAMYRFGTLGHVLTTPTLVTLTSVGVVRNAAILLTGHIGYAWAVHASWNLVMFSGRWVEQPTGRGLTEPETFDTLLGSTPLVVASAGAALVLLVALARSRPEPERPT